jgi:hypothetical protein
LCHLFYFPATTAGKEDAFFLCWYIKTDTIYTIRPASHTEGDGMSMAHSRGKNHENYTS